MSGPTKAVVASGMLLALLALSWFTLEPGNVRTLAMIVLGMFLFRILLHTARSRGKQPEDEDASEQDSR
ncbi:MAG: hypothetical protein ACYDC6_06800 [Acidobacteriaceae bacterium]